MNNTENTIEINDLSKEYRYKTVFKDINISLQAGEILGLTGPNGGGKTTLLKILATLVRPTSGSVFIHGYDAFRSPSKVRPVIGYMPEYYRLYEDLKVWEYLDFFAAAYKIPKVQHKSLVRDVMELTDLTGLKDMCTRLLSRGMKQRLLIAKTLVHDPAVLLLDEPACGLDPKFRLEFMEIIRELGNMGKTIIISSSILPEIEGICDKVAILSNEVISFAGKNESLLDEYLRIIQNQGVETDE
ncbi:ATP-binding cassette domain-containing protein [Candidatus Poribacteria bacterium]|nr:ATP-binding cassette domain-containing protein [Candidatus Poribacteria bacterium]